jgi:hypothetical protein
MSAACIADHLHLEHMLRRSGLQSASFSRLLYKSCVASLFASQVLYRVYQLFLQVHRPASLTTTSVPLPSVLLVSNVCAVDISAVGTLPLWSLCRMVLCGSAACCVDHSVLQDMTKTSLRTCIVLDPVYMVHAPLQSSLECHVHVDCCSTAEVKSCNEGIVACLVMCSRQSCQHCSSMK